MPLRDRGEDGTAIHPDESGFIRNKSIVTQGFAIESNNEIANTLRAVQQKMFFLLLGERYFVFISLGFSSLGKSLLCDVGSVKSSQQQATCWTVLPSWLSPSNRGSVYQPLEN